MFLGKLTLSITCADTAHLLNLLNMSDVTLLNVYKINDFEIKLTISYADFGKVKNICYKQGATVKLFAKYGTRFWILAILKRPVISICLIIGALLSLYLPSRIFFVLVEGNVSVPSNEIIEAAEMCGITFGTNSREIRSEKMKNALLQAVPELQWAGINTSGCTAVISVKEKNINEISDTPQGVINSIVALRDGIIQSSIVYQGNSLCVSGQAVKEGQLLVSAYTDCGLVTTATQAKAEITALTFRDIEVVSPSATWNRGGVREKTTRYSVRIGKNLINFYKDSGNCDATCAKIYEQEYIQLPGGFTLPIAIIKETVYYYDLLENSESMGADEWLPSFAKLYLYNQMIAGKIISCSTDVITDADLTTLYGKYACSEMIGKVKVEQTIEGE